MSLQSYRPRVALLLLPVILLAVMVRGPARPAPAQADAGSIEVVHEGYDRLLNLYVDPLWPDELLTEAWNGAAAAAIVAGVDSLPVLEPLPQDRAGAWEAFAAAFAELERAAAGLISPEKLAHAALEAMAGGRDECHTYFLTPERFARFQEQLAGRARIVGIGVQITTRPPFTIINVFPDSPAERAGLASGDVIVAVDGIPAAEQTSASLSLLIRGAAGTDVTLSILREPDAVPFDVTMTRAVIRIPTLTTTLRPDGIAVLTLNVFADNGSSERLLREALRDLEARGATAWILDLRLNAGGSVPSVHNVLGAFLERDMLATTLVTRDGRTRQFAVGGEPEPIQRPLAVLVGPASASGAEIVAAVLQDTGRARVFGQPTAGCANVGTLTALADGSGLIVTSARLLAGPQLRPLDDVGVTPDEETRVGAGDPTLQAAVAYLLGQVPAAQAADPRR